MQTLGDVLKAKLGNLVSSAEEEAPAEEAPAEEAASSDEEE